MLVVGLDIHQGFLFGHTPPQASFPALGDLAPTFFGETARPDTRLRSNENNRVIHGVGAVAVGARVIMHALSFPCCAVGVALSEEVPRSPTSKLQ